MKRLIIIVALHANHGGLEISNFLNVARSFLLKVLSEIWGGRGETEGGFSSETKRKNHLQCSNCKKDTGIYTCSRHYC